MKKKSKVLAIVLPITAVIILAVWYLSRHTIAVMEPAGQIGAQEKHLIIIGVLLAVIVVVPVYTMAILFAFRYRESNHNAHYRPDWDHSRLYESLWWGIPMVIIGILSVITWHSAHALDPYRSLGSTVKPLRVQVISLDWKWLFIYPDQHVASVNQVVMPVNTPVDFYITSDTVMNSFWIPQLGGQIYAMPGMSTQLHLEADKTGNFYGTPANIAGKGFATMTFTATALSASNFQSWLHRAANSHMRLDQAAYDQLAQASENNSIAYYSNVRSGLYNDIVMKYMNPPSTMQMGGVAQ